MKLSIFKVKYRSCETRVSHVKHVKRSVKQWSALGSYGTVIWNSNQTATTSVPVRYLDHISSIQTIHIYLIY